MKFYSDITNTFYDTVEACEKAEKEHNNKITEKKAKEKVLKEARDKRLKEVEKAYEAMIEAEKQYTSLRDKFINDYGSFYFDPFRFAFF